MERWVARICMVCLAWCLTGALLQAQPKPPASGERRKRSNVNLANRFQIGLFAGVSLNINKGEYEGACPCTFPKAGNGWSGSYGLSVNLPITQESALYLRGGFNHA